jgi:hypothetical protein
MKTIEQIENELQNITLSDVNFENMLSIETFAKDLVLDICETKNLGLLKIQNKIDEKEFLIRKDFQKKNGIRLLKMIIRKITNQKINKKFENTKIFVNNYS